MKKILFFTLLILFTLKMKGQNTSQELMEIKKELITHAIEIGKDYNIQLDFSEESIKDVETILSDLHNNYTITQDDDGLNGIAHIFGFYIMEVIDKNHGKGSMEQNHPDFGENTFPFYWNEQTLFPIAWCQKRIFDGDADNVPMKYQVLILEEKK